MVIQSDLKVHFLRSLYLINGYASSRIKKDAQVQPVELIPGSAAEEDFLSQRLNSNGES